MANQKIHTFVEKYYDNSLNNIGNYNSFTNYGDQWAQAATAPHSMYKAWSTEGAIVCPLIIHYSPLLQNQAGTILKQFVTVMDILPTVLDLAGVKHPGQTYKGRRVATPRGKSWVNYLSGKASFVHDENTVTGWELFGQQAIRKSQYKALYIPKPFGPEKWQLFDVVEDPGETEDLAEKEPEVLKELTDHWAVYASETGLIELGPDFFKVGKPGTVNREYITLDD